MKHIILTLLIILSWVPISGSAKSTDPHFVFNFSKPSKPVIRSHEFKYGYSFGDKKNSLFSDYAYKLRNINFQLDTVLKLTTLVQEPVVTAKFRWFTSDPSNVVDIPSYSSGTTILKKVSLSALGGKARDLISLYNVKIGFIYRKSNSRIQLVADMGVVAKGDGQEWSFNVSGSPNWNRLFINHGNRIEYGNLNSQTYLTAEEAKDAYREITYDDYTFVGINLHNAHISLYDLQSWYAKNSQEFKVGRLKDSVKKLKDSIKENFGYEFSFLIEPNEPYGYSPNYQIDQNGSYLPDWANNLTDYEEIYQKLVNLPEDLQRHGYAPNFKRDIREIESYLRSSNIKPLNWQSTEPQ